LGETVEMEDIASAQMAADEARETVSKIVVNLLSVDARIWAPTLGARCWYQMTVLVGREG